MESRKPNLWTVTAAAVALAGLADSLYLSYKRLTLNPLFCTDAGCDIVTTSAYSAILGVPVAYMGVLYYALLLGLVILYILRTDARFLLSAKVAVSIGLLFSAWFVYVQFFIIGEICPYCIFSAVITLALVLLFWSRLVLINKNNEEENE